MSGEIYVQDFAALETLFKRFYKPLRAYAFRFVNDRICRKILFRMFFMNFGSGVKVSVLRMNL